MTPVNPAHEKLVAEGSLRRAIEVFEAEWSADKMNFGPDRPETVRTQVRYADVLRMAGDYEAAAEMYRDILLKMEFYPEQFIDEVLDVKLSLANIIYRKDANEAKELIDGLEEFVVIMPMNDTKIALKKKLAETMRDVGRYESALEYFDEIYKFKCNNNPRSLETLSSHVDIATVYLEQGRCMKAMDILESIHEEANNTDPNHPCTLKAERYIADVCMHYGMTMIACMKYERVAQAQVKETPRSLDALTTLHKLSLAYLKDGRPKKALQVIEDLYNIRKVETPWHPDTKRVEIDFMMMQLREGDVSKATFLLLSALENKSDCFEFETIVDIPRNIAMFFRSLNESGKTEEAIKIYEYLYQKQCQMSRLGPLHPETLLTKTNIAETYLHLNNLDEALRIFKEVLDLKLNVLKNDSMDCLDVRKHIAEIYYTEKAFHESFNHYCEVYRNERMFLGAYHDVTIDTENIVDGFCLIEPQSNLIKAIKTNDFHSVKNICKAQENTDIDAQDYYGCTPLHAAVMAGYPKIIRYLLRRGASLFVKNKSGKIPRELSKRNDVKSIFSRVIQLFMDVKLGNRRDIAEVLSFDDGTLVNVLDEEGKTVLHWACQKGDIDTVNLVLNKGADPRIRDKSDDKALDIAARLNHAEIVAAINRHLEEPDLQQLYIRSPGRE